MNALWQRITLLFQTAWARITARGIAQPLPVIPAEPPMAANTDAKPRVKKGDKDFISQDFYFREAILDELDNYFVHLKNMKRSDPDSYALYKKLGATILPDSAKIDRQELSPWFRQKLPGFGAIASGIGTKCKEHEKKIEKIYPRFICFTKYDKYHRPKDIQAANIEGAFYKLTLFWDDPQNDFKPVITEMALLLASDGQVYPLKHQLQKMVKIKHKRGDKHYRTSVRPQSRWDFPDQYKLWAKDHGKTVEDDLIELFILAANLYEASLSGMVSVSARNKKGLVAKFNIDPRRTPYFFKDREQVVAGAGHNRKIFHIVRQHIREGKEGGQVAIKTHFRGLRSFMWNGHAVSITVPGRDHMNVGLEFDVGSLSSEYDDIKGKTLGMGKLADFLTDKIEQDLADRNITLH